MYILYEMYIVSISRSSMFELSLKNWISKLDSEDMIHYWFFRNIEISVEKQKDLPLFADFSQAPINFRATYFSVSNIIRPKRYAAIICNMFRLRSGWCTTSSILPVSTLDVVSTRDVGSKLVLFVDGVRRNFSRGWG